MNMVTVVLPCCILLNYDIIVLNFSERLVIAEDLTITNYSVCTATDRQEFSKLSTDQRTMNQATP